LSGRPFCSVSEKGKPCPNISDYIITVFEHEVKIGLPWNGESEQIELCSEHYRQLADFLNRVVLSDFPDKTREKVEFT